LDKIRRIRNFLAHNSWVLYDEWIYKILRGDNKSFDKWIESLNYLTKRFGEEDLLTTLNKDLKKEKIKLNKNINFVLFS
jgi:hypothetical protein